jgi:hypothetical protein
MRLTDAILLTIAVIIFLNWYEHSKIIPKYSVKCRNIVRRLKGLFIRQLRRNKKCQEVKEI